MSRLTTAVAVASAVAALAVPATATADGSPATSASSVTVNPGTLGWLTAPVAGNFTAVTLDGAAQTTYASLNNWGVDDERGTGAGWNVTAQATQFSTGGDSPLTLPEDSLEMTVPTSVTSGSGQTAAPAIANGPLTLDGGSPVTVATAAANTGLAEWTFTQGNGNGGDLALSVPAGALAGTYSSTITFTLGTTP